MFSFFLLGYLYQKTFSFTSIPNRFDRIPARFFSVSVIDEPRIREKYTEFRASVNTCFFNGRRHPAAGNMLVRVRGGSGTGNPEYGSQFLIPANYAGIPGPANPGEFDYRSWLFNQNILYRCTLNAQQLIPLKSNSAGTIPGWLIKFRQRQISFYRTLIKNKEAFAVASTLILGYRSDLSQETLADYTKTGTIHALSVSGMHVGMVYLILDRALRMLNRNKLLSLVKILLMIMAIWLYTLLTGYSPSALRSAVMLTLFIAGKSMGRPLSGDRILSSSALLLLIYNPLLLWDAGFQLSYLAVAGLIFLHPQIRNLITFRIKLIQHLWSLISISLAAQIFTFPFSIYYFHQFPTYFLLGNLFIALPATAVMYLGLALLVLRWSWIAIPFEWSIQLMNKGLDVIAHLPYSTIGQIWINKPELIILFFSVILFNAAMAGGKTRHFYYPLILLLFFEGSSTFRKIQVGRPMRLLPFYLQRGYAVAVISGKSATLITDLEPESTSFQIHVQPALGQSGIDRIQFKNWDNIKKRTSTSNQHQLLAAGKKILLADSLLNGKTIQNRAEFDIIWIHGNTQLDLMELSRKVSFQEIWLDGSSNRYTIRRICQDALLLNCSIRVFKAASS